MNGRSWQLSDVIQRTEHASNAGLDRGQTELIGRDPGWHGG